MKLKKQFFVERLNLLESNELDPVKLLSLIEKCFGDIHSGLENFVFDVDDEEVQLAWKLLAAILLKSSNLPHLMKSIGQNRRILPFLQHFKAYLLASEIRVSSDSPLLFMLVVLQYFPTNIPVSLKKELLQLLVSFVCNPKLQNKRTIELGCRCISLFSKLGSQKADNWQGFMRVCISQLAFCVQSCLTEDPEPLNPNNDDTLVFPEIENSCNFYTILSRIRVLKLIIHYLLVSVPFKEAVQFQLKAFIELFLNVFSTKPLSSLSKLDLSQFYPLLLEMCSGVCAVSKWAVIGGTMPNLIAALFRLLTNYYKESWAFHVYDCLTHMVNAHSMVLGVHNFVERTSPLIIQTLTVCREQNKIAESFTINPVTTVDQAADLLQHKANTNTALVSEMHNSCCAFLISILNCSGPFLKSGFYSDVQRAVCQCCVTNLGSGSPYVPPLECSTNRVNLYKLLQTLLLNPHPKVAVPVHLATHIFEFGLNDNDMNVVDVCRRGARIAQSIRRPLVPPWGTIPSVQSSFDIKALRLGENTRKFGAVATCTAEVVSDDDSSDSEPVKQTPHRCEVVQEREEDSDDIEILESDTIESLAPPSKKKRIQKEVNERVEEVLITEIEAKDDCSVDVLHMINDFEDSD